MSINNHPAKKRVLMKLLVGYDLTPDERSMYLRERRKFDEARKRYVSAGRYILANNHLGAPVCNEYTVVSRRHGVEVAANYPDAIRKAKCFINDAKAHGEFDIVDIEFNGRVVRSMMTSSRTFLENRKKVPKYMKKFPYSEWPFVGDPVIQDIIMFERRILGAAKKKKNLNLALSDLNDLKLIVDIVRGTPSESSVLPKLLKAIELCEEAIRKAWPRKAHYVPRRTLASIKTPVVEPPVVTPPVVEPPVVEPPVTTDSPAGYHVWRMEKKQKPKYTFVPTVESGSTEPPPMELPPVIESKPSLPLIGYDPKKKDESKPVEDQDVLKTPMQALKESSYGEEPGWTIEELEAAKRRAEAREKEPVKESGGG